MSGLQSVSAVKNLLVPETIPSVGLFLGRLITYNPALVLPIVFIVGMIVGAILYKLYRDSQPSHSTQTNQNNSSAIPLHLPEANKPENKFIKIKSHFQESPARQRKKEKQTEQKENVVKQLKFSPEKISDLTNLQDEEDKQVLYDLGYAYENGEDGVDIDLEMAFSYYKKSADKGDTTAQTQVGYMYENGEGVDKNLKEAFKYYTMAAKNGSEGAKLQLKQEHFAPFILEKAP